MKVGNYEQMMAYLKDPFNPSELRARVKELEPREESGRTNFYRGMSANKAKNVINLRDPKTLEGSERPTKKGTKKYKDIKSIRELDPII